MVDIPETRYAHNGPVNLAYQVVGDGPIDLLVVAGGLTHLDYVWHYEPLARFMRRLASFSRMVLYDPRGCGLSDRTLDPPTIPLAVSDALAVLDTVGVERANVYGHLDGGSVGLALAATHPDRVDAVAVYGAVCRFRGLEELLVPFDRDEPEKRADSLESIWGGSDLLELVAPNYADDPALTRWFTSLNRAAMSPAGAAAWYEYLANIDLRPLLADVAAPVLVTNRSETRALHRSQALYLAEHLPDARHVEFPGEDYLTWLGDTAEPITDEIEEFFTGTRPTHAPTRALAAVMFTDIVGSTQQAADLGDEAWRALLTRHDDLTHQRVEEHGGRVVKSTGDGALAAFDDPEDAIGAAQSLIADLAGAGLDIRVGIHSGQIEITGDDVAGMAVHLAARISALAGPGDIYVSRTVKDLVIGSGIEFDDRGTHDLKGIPDQWQILAVVADPPA
jgi:class 3 adenylate cyclase